MFVELENGSLINLEHVVKVHPKAGSNRIDFITGAHLQLTDAEVEKVREAILHPQQMYVPLNEYVDRTMADGIKMAGEILNPQADGNSQQEEKPKKSSAKRRGTPPKAKAEAK